MPLSRVTLINKSQNHRARATLVLQPGAVAHVVDAPANSCVALPAPPPGPFTTISGKSMVEIFIHGTNTVGTTLILNGPIGGSPADDIEEVVVYVGLQPFNAVDDLPNFEFVVAKIENGGTKRLETHELL